MFADLCVCMCSLPQLASTFYIKPSLAYQLAISSHLYSLGIRGRCCQPASYRCSPVTSALMLHPPLMYFTGGWGVWLNASWVSRNIGVCKGCYCTVLKWQYLIPLSFSITLNSPIQYEVLHFIKAVCWGIHQTGCCCVQAISNFWVTECGGWSDTVTVLMSNQCPEWKDNMPVVWRTSYINARTLKTNIMQNVTFFSWSLLFKKAFSIFIPKVVQNRFTDNTILGMLIVWDFHLCH